MFRSGRDVKDFIYLTKRHDVQLEMKNVACVGIKSHRNHSGLIELSKIMLLSLCVCAACGINAPPIFSDGYFIKIKHTFIETCNGVLVEFIVAG